MTEKICGHHGQDPESDFCDDCGEKIVTCSGCGWTGRLSLTTYYDGTLCPKCGDYTN